MKAIHHPYTGISARPGSASTFSRLHWLNAFARRRRCARLLGADDGSAISPANPANPEQLRQAAKNASPQRAGAAVPHVLHIDCDMREGLALGCLLMPEARVTNVATLADAHAILKKELFALVVIDPALPDGDAAGLLSLIAGTPLLVYAADRPSWGSGVSAYLPKPWTSARQLWTTISTLLGLPQPTSAGD